MPTPDRIEKSVILRASVARVWRAVSDSREFGRWFGVELDGPFVAGAKLSGCIRPTTADAATADLQRPYDGHPVAWWVECVEPMRAISFRWHPFAIERDRDYSSEPTTLIELVLTEVPHGTHLAITESGFDRIPLERRAKAFEANTGGWAMQAELIAKHLAAAAT